ncbi:PREDICTED: probable disease resistance RPP8-like protein 2 [Prunus mume]|uniref:Probable disease resistance RPP8-like protein 2 n=1 Tax=Prunus mume TaxID=102107 RepID=A0ABM0NWX3_PRUMU|nr:PREDICTED: probable disease resistance RPP8-like protein 2 [Prunus mume]
MAELAVATAVEKLTNLIIQEAILLDGVGEKVEQIRNELRWMQSFLKDADHAAEQDRNERFRNWVSQIREVAFDAEDVVETYLREAAAASQSLWKKVVMPIHVHKVKRGIEKIQTRIDHISKQKDSFGIASMIASSREGGEGSISTNERLRWWRQPLPHIEEDDLVDLVQDTEALLTQLSSMEPRRRVVSIVGMGGLGKTTLAKKLYNHIELRHQFNCKAFVYVSQEYRRRETLRRIIKDVNVPYIGDSEEVDEEEMVKQLYEFLRGRKYLVVLDDVWEKEVWDSLEAAFPTSGMAGSKVMLTTRNREVALHADARSTPHEPRMLTEDESLELFRKKALSGMDHFPSDLENQGREMVTKCGGLPLALVVLGGLLSRKMKTREEWEHVLQNISWHLIDQDRVSAILALSYKDLPFYLKSCFLHLGLFPEDFSIPKTQLMRLWVAEGFLPQQGEDTTEGVAENCLNELINRCMIQVRTLTSLGRVKTISIHDLLRDFSLSVSRDENFLGICTGREVESSVSPSSKSRRIALHSNPTEHTVLPSPFLNPCAPHLRSLHFFNRFLYPEVYFIKNKDFKLLKVLDLKDTIGFMRLPSTIGILIQLRYLGLSQILKTYYIPASIGNLKNLETLNLGSSYSPIPNVIWKMKRLRHMLLRDVSKPNRVNLRLDTLSHLQTLKTIRAGRWIEDGGLANMISLRRLGIERLSQEKVNLVISILRRMCYLQSLSLEVMNNETFPTSMGLSHFQHLHKLCLKGKIEKLPDACEFPPNLVKLSLIGSELQKDSIVQLERLPYLKMLVLGNQSYKWRELVSSSEGFPQLQVLHLVSLMELEEWTVEENAMMKLKHLKIEDCPRLKNPERLVSNTVTILQVVTRYDPLKGRRSPEWTKASSNRLDCFKCFQD